ncbi:MAG: hypothetical protein GW898_10420 [Thiomicrospira sp.]|nr:hypothetical protein [Thiomicrospira sp.]NCN66317.1 hypothetical protein [Thiomicrospira sp.]NCO14770.1 hypothetical protein [Thiomicrospira sp.]NCO82367.1 hypothetical protein [Thiomicrospira sp.]OIP95504.1 MAG: hypothetical protein AUK56_05535 [Thiomicrospira sp. CG2_30_44_34]
MKIKKAIFIAVIASVAQQPAFAVDVDVVQAQSYPVRAALNEYSVLEIAGKKTGHADVDADSCEIDVERSKALGKLVFKPLQDKPFTMFVSDRSGKTYPIRVDADKKIAPGLVLIHDKKFEKEKKFLRSNKFQQLEKTQSVVELAGSRNSAITSLIRAMIEGSEPMNVDIRTANEPVYVWNEADILKTKTFEVGHLVGTEYRIKNTSKNNLVIAEKEFYALFKNVMAVSILNTALSPGEETRVFIVKSINDGRG